MMRAYGRKAPRALSGVVWAFDYCLRPNDVSCINSARLHVNAGNTCAAPHPEGELVTLGTSTPLKSQTMPRTPQNLVDLRQTFAVILGNQKAHYSDSRIPEILHGLGLDDFPDSGSKREPFQGAVRAAGDEQLVGAVQNALNNLALAGHERDELQELLWDDGSTPPVPARYRREATQGLEQLNLALAREGFHRVLTQLWCVDDVTLPDFLHKTPTLREQIVRHYIDNNDWSAVELFDKLGAFRCSDARFCRFLEALGSSLVRPDEAAQRMYIEAINPALQPCGVHCVAVTGSDGYLDIAIALMGGGQQSAPKNLIFASASKPDLRISNALDNDVEVVNNADKVLIYDRPIGTGGLRWRELQAWFAHAHGMPEALAKDALYRRLRASLPESSPPQMLAFTSFYKAFAKVDVPNLPALLPEVWFHWDPQTVLQRGKQALLRSRMDFLLLLPGGVRVVIEVDGSHHYATDDGRASSKRYSDMMAADRSLRLAGYEVYRFGGHELSQPGADTLMIDFYRSLFRRYGLISHD